MSATEISDMQVSAIMQKMYVFYKGNREDINHTVKVHSYARTIGILEGLPEKTQKTLEITAIVHDISCPLCRKKYGDTDGKHQEAESEGLVKDFLKEFNLPSDVLERVVYLVCHHHTYTHVDGPDYQILLEADFLVNCDESAKYRKGYQTFKEKVFKTPTGRQMLHEMFPELG